MILEFNGKSPKIGKGVFIAPTACVIGDVTLGDGVSLWYGAVVRADRAPIVLGRDTNIQDNCTLHADPDYPLTLGEGVTVGHNVVLHGCTVEDNVLVGMAAVVLNGAVIKSGSVIAAGSLVREGQIVGPHHLMTGVPAALKKVLPPEGVSRIRKPAETYRFLAAEHSQALGDGADHGNGK